MGEAATAVKERYTYGDYKSWDDDLRWELIDGEAYCMVIVATSVASNAHFLKTL